MAVVAPSRSRILPRVLIGVCALATIIAGAIPFGALVMGLALSHAFRSDERLKFRFAMLGGVVTMLMSVWLIVAPTTVTAHIDQPVAVTAPSQQH